MVKRFSQIIPQVNLDGRVFRFSPVCGAVARVYGLTVVARPLIHPFHYAQHGALPITFPISKE